MKKGILIIVIFLFITLFLTCKRAPMEHVSTNSSSILSDWTKPAVTDIKSTISENQSVLNETQSIPIDIQITIDNDGIAWIIEPILEYDNVYYCFVCGYTANNFSYILNKWTGEIDGPHYGHGGPYYQSWLYDSENEMFGFYRYGWDEELIIHNINQFSTHFPSNINTLRFVKQFDYENIIINENELWGKSYKLGEKYENSKFAIFYDNILLTEFIYDSPDNLTYNFIYKNAIPVSRNGKWGFINTKGDIIIPFIFDHIASSDGEIAFVLINGKYGIIDVGSSIYN